MHSSRMRTTRFSDRLYLGVGWGGVGVQPLGLGGMSAYGSGGVSASGSSAEVCLWVQGGVCLSVGGGGLSTTHPFTIPTSHGHVTGTTLFAFHFIVLL